MPKISLVAAPADGGTICTRTFIPIRVHDSIGVLGAVSVATALLLDGAAGADLAVIKPGQTRFGIEHPTGQLEVETEVDQAMPAAPGRPLGRGAHRAQALRRHRLSTEVPVTSPQIGSGAAAATRPPLHDVAHLGHIELLTPKIVREPVVLRGDARHDRDLPRGQLGVPAHLGRLRAPHGQAHRARRPRASAGVGLRASSQAALERAGGGDRGGRAGRRPGRTATPASGRPTCSATRTGMSWSSTGRPSGTRRRMSSSRR